MLALLYEAAFCRFSSPPPNFLPLPPLLSFLRLPGPSSILPNHALKPRAWESPLSGQLQPGGILSRKCSVGAWGSERGCRLRGGVSRREERGLRILGLEALQEWDERQKVQQPSFRSVPMSWLTVLPTPPLQLCLGRFRAGQVALLELAAGKAKSGLTEELEEGPEGGERMC